MRQLRVAPRHTTDTAMNTLDLVIALTVVAAGIGGWRFGLVARLLAWCGVVAGFAIGIAFVCAASSPGSAARAPTIVSPSPRCSFLLRPRSDRPPAGRECARPSFHPSASEVGSGAGRGLRRCRCRRVRLDADPLARAGGRLARSSRPSFTGRAADRSGDARATFRVRGRRARDRASALSLGRPGRRRSGRRGQAARFDCASRRRPCSFGRRGERRCVLEGPARVRLGRGTRHRRHQRARDRRCIADPGRGCVWATAHRRGRRLRPAPRPRAAQRRWLGRRSAAARRGHGPRRRLRLSRERRARAGTGSASSTGARTGSDPSTANGASGTCSCSRCNWRMATPAGRS